MSRKGSFVVDVVRRRGALTFVALALVLSGCGGGTQSVAMALRDAGSAVAATQLALEAEQDQRVTSALTAVLVDEAATQVSSAQSQLSSFAPSTSDDADVTAKAARALSSAEEAVRGAKDAVAGFRGSPSVEDALALLDETEHALADAADGAGKPR